MNDEADYFGWWDEIEREVWIRDECKCVYCGEDGLKSFEHWCLMETDHLIPRRYFRDNPAEAALRDHIEIRVVSCRTCNAYKKGFNPNGDGSLPTPPDKAWRLEMIRRAKEWIAVRREKNPDLRCQRLKMMRRLVAERHLSA